MPARLLVWLRTNGLMKIGHLYCYLIKYCIDDLLSLRMDPPKLASLSLHSLQEASG